MQNAYLKPSQKLINMARNQGISMKELSAELGVSQPTLRNADHQLTIVELNKLCDLLGISLSNALNCMEDEVYPQIERDVDLADIREAYRNDQFFRCIAISRHVANVSLSPRKQAAAHIYKAACFNRMGRFSDARKAYTEAFEINGAGDAIKTMVCLNLANSALQLDELHNARVYLDSIRGRLVTIQDYVPSMVEDVEPYSEQDDPTLDLVSYAFFPYVEAQIGISELLISGPLTNERAETTSTAFRSAAERYEQLGKHAAFEHDTWHGAIALTSRAGEAFAAVAAGGEPDGGVDSIRKIADQAKAFRKHDGSVCAKHSETVGYCRLFEGLLHLHYPVNHQTRWANYHSAVSDGRTVIEGHGAWCLEKSYFMLQLQHMKVCGIESGCQLMLQLEPDEIQRLKSVMNRFPHFWQKSFAIFAASRLA